MKVKVENWALSEIIDLKDDINEQPVYQRGAVWGPRKQKILIDSILRGIDIPKIYLRRTKSRNYQYEVADGQQRLTAIWEFHNNNKGSELAQIEENGLDLSRIYGIKVINRKFKDLPKSLKERFLNYQLTIAIVEDATNEEIRTLFGRLQMGSSLNPAEKRNAIISQIGVEIDNLALNHDFFSNSKINESRFKHQDYITHAIALVYFENKLHLKADTLLQLYLELGKVVPAHLISKTVATLDYMRSIDIESDKKIINKWAFLDIFYLFFNKINDIKSINAKAFAKRFSDFEKRRLEYHNRPNELIEGKKPTSGDKDLYTYITAFKVEGGSPKKIMARNEVFNRLFESDLNLKS